MRKRYLQGQPVFIIENNLRVRPAHINRCCGDFYIVLTETGCALRLRSSRLFPSLEEAQNALHPSRERAPEERRKFIQAFG